MRFAAAVLLVCALVGVGVQAQSNGGGQGSTGFELPSIFGEGLDLSQLGWDTPRVDDAVTQANEWFESVREAAQDSLGQYPLLQDLLSRADEGSTADSLVDALGINTENRPFLNGEGIFTQGFLTNLGNSSWLFSGEPLSGAIVQDIQNAIDAVGRDGPVGQFLSDLFSSAAPEGQQSMFQSVTDALRNSADGGLLQQALNRIQEANGGSIPALDGQYVNQIQKLLRNSLSSFGSNIGNQIVRQGRD